ncbi:hypothetical protein B296_00021175 [Ensete ventricosum]|uniref:Uncharacterized protein n=1 Tax=Ensete ventricosum TaxID=4639 RepID=A0A426XY84_ENSVE|nr:hypothetical protein B296_00021175 [Ensete ventricosum]
MRTSPLQGRPPTARPPIGATDYGQGPYRGDHDHITIGAACKGWPPVSMAATYRVARAGIGNACPPARGCYPRAMMPAVRAIASGARCCHLHRSDGRWKGQTVRDSYVTKG